MAQRIEIDAFGGPEQLRLREFEPPAPGDGQLLVRQLAIGVNPFDWKFVAGGTVREAPAFPVVAGMEGAGVVEAVGEGVDFAVGDEVITRQYLGAFASHRVVKAANTWAKPAAMGFEQAAVISLAGATAWAALTAANVGIGDTVLVHNASGGVGSAAVQIARRLGARVIGTASARNHDYVRGMGAEPVEYGDGLVERVVALGGVTAAVDFVGDAGAVAATLALVSDLSRASTAAGTPQSDEVGITRLRAVADDSARAIALAAAGGLSLEITRSFALADAAAALTLSRDGHVRGKIVLTV